MSSAADGVAVISIHGRDYSFKAPAGKQGELQAAAERLNTVLAETKGASPLLDNDRLVVLAALNLCAQLIQAEQQAEQYQALSTRVDGIAQLIVQQLGK